MSKGIYDKDVEVSPPGYEVDRHVDEKGARRKSSITAAFAAGDTDAIEGQLFSMNALDPALDAKLRLVNQVGLQLIVCYPH